MVVVKCLSCFYSVRNGEGRCTKGFLFVPSLSEGGEVWGGMELHRKGEDLIKPSNYGTLVEVSWVGTSREINILGVIPGLLCFPSHILLFKCL